MVQVVGEIESSLKGIKLELLKRQVDMGIWSTYLHI